MTAPLDDSNAFGALPGDAPTASFLTRLLAFVDSSRRSALVAGEPGTSPDDAETWQEALDRAGRTAGVRVNDVNLTSREACDPGRFVSPLATSNNAESRCPARSHSIRNRALPSSPAPRYVTVKA